MENSIHQYNMRYQYTLRNSLQMGVLSLLAARTNRFDYGIQALQSIILPSQDIKTPYRILISHRMIVPLPVEAPDGTILLWDRIGKRVNIEILGHTGGIKALTYTADNRIRACGTGLDGKLRLWDAGTSSELSILHEHTGLTRAVTFSKDGKIIASGGSEDDTIFLSDVLKILEPGEAFSKDSLITILKGNIHGITALAFSPADTTFASGGADGRIHLLDVATGRELKILRGAHSTITALTFVVDGTHLFSGEENGTIRQWNALTGEEVGTVYRNPVRHYHCPIVLIL